MGGIGAIVTATGIDSPALGLTLVWPIGAVAPRRTPRVISDPVSGEDIIDGVPYTVVEQHVARTAPPTARPRSNKRVKISSDALHGIWTVMRSIPDDRGPHADALRAYAPYKSCLGMFVDVWA